MTTVHRPLAKRFRSKGFDYELLDRVGDVALFKQTKPIISRASFEVVIVQRHDGYSLAGTHVPPAETMPPTSLWGRLGFTYSDLAAANKKFRELQMAASLKTTQAARDTGDA